jgi:hypothetical protein
LPLAATILLGACVTVPRRAAPPGLIDQAVPDGFSPDIRLVTTDLPDFKTRSPRFFRGIRTAADGSIDILALSGGGAGGAFGAGALVGLSRAHARPQFELVTGVSAGALIAPFAFLGPAWDGPLQRAFSGADVRIMRSPRLSVLARLLFPQGFRRRSPLFDLVDHYVTPAMISAVARESAKGRRLIVATTDLDKQETVLWDMGAIAARGGEPARRLFRDVLIASASIPGVFPPVLIHVHGGDTHYDELHVDGSVTTPVFAAPLIAEILPSGLAQLRGANLYMIVNGQLATTPRTTPFSTLSVLSASFSAAMTYKTREAIVTTVGFARRYDMKFHLTEIPVDYPFGSFVDFSPAHLRKLFDYAADCAARHLLWITPEQSIRRNITLQRPVQPDRSPTCPATPGRH